MLKALFAKLFGPIAGSIKGALILPEILRAIALGLAAASIPAGVSLTLTALATAAPVLTSNYALASVLTFVFTHLAALALQLGQGKPVAGAEKSDVPPVAVAFRQLLSRVDHPKFGVVRSFITDEARSGPVFEDSVSAALWELLGKPRIPGLGL
jgi:hypothetical protein